MITMDLFYTELLKLLDILATTQKTNIKKAAEICAKAIKNNGVIHVFGSGHSVGFGLELVNQSGSLVPIHTIMTSDFVLKKQVSLEQFKDRNVMFERTPGIADKLYDLYPIDPNDVFIIISNSGINGLVIDLAAKAKEKNHPVIVVTSIQHTNSEDSRHPSGKKLYEYGDIVIDNCGPCGDALLETEDSAKICSVSAITGVFIAQSLTAEIISKLQTMTDDIPILWDLSKKGALEHNKALKEKYKERI